jgi:hypothetical protein
MHNLLPQTQPSVFDRNPLGRLRRPNNGPPVEQVRNTKLNPKANDCPRKFAGAGGERWRKFADSGIPLPASYHFEETGDVRIGSDYHCKQSIVLIQVLAAQAF